VVEPFYCQLAIWHLLRTQKRSIYYSNYRYAWTLLIANYKGSN
jgi:hypothetical protein